MKPTLTLLAALLLAPLAALNAQEAAANTPKRSAFIYCKGRLKSAAGGAGWRGGRKVQHLQITKENVARYGTMGRYTP